jgi:hypothetical protein
VLVARPVAAPPDRESAGVEVDVRPAEAQRLHLAEAERERDAPAGAVPPLPHRGQNVLHLLDRERLDLRLAEPRRLRQLRRVCEQVTTPDRLSEGCPDRAVRLMGGPGRAAARHHLYVQPLQVLGLEPVQPVSGDAADQVDADGDPVAGEGVLRDERRGDVLDPVREPLLDRPRPAGPLHAAGVPLFLQVADLPSHLGPGLGLHVPTVGPAVVTGAHRDAAVPLAVLALVDR